MKIDVTIPTANESLQKTQVARAHDAIEKAVAGFAKHIAVSINNRANSGNNSVVFNVRHEHMAYREFCALIGDVLTAPPFNYRLTSAYVLDTERGQVSVMTLAWDDIPRKSTPRYLGDRG